MGAALAAGVVALVIRTLLQAPAPTPAGTGSPPGSQASTPRPSPTATIARVPPVEVKRTAISTVDSEGRLQWEIRAETASVDSLSRTATLTRVEGTYFHEGGPAVTFAAPKGTFFVATRNMTLSDGVRARAAGGETLEAKVVRWDPGRAQIEATGSVVLRQGGMTVRADRLMTDTSLRLSSMSGNVRVTVDR